MERAGDGHVLQVRRCGDAETGANARVDQDLIDRRHQIIHRSDGMRNKRRGDSLRARPDMDGNGLDGEAFDGFVAHAFVDFQDRRPFAIDQDFNQLIFAGHQNGGVAEQLAADRSHHGEREGVGAIGRKLVHHRHAATRAERRPRHGRRSPAG